MALKGLLCRLIPSVAAPTVQENIPKRKGISSLSRSCMGREGHGCPVCKYTWSIGCCVTWSNTPVLSSCCSLVIFKPSKDDPIGFFDPVKGRLQENIQYPIDGWRQISINTHPSHTISQVKRLVEGWFFLI